MGEPLDPLESLFKRYHRAEFIATDPLEIVKSYPRASDREVVGLVAAVLAYGQVRPMKDDIRRILEPLGSRPAAFLRAAPLRRIRAPRGWAHRFVAAADGTVLLRSLASLLRDRGRLRTVFLEGHRAAAPTVRPALDHFVDALRAACERTAGIPWDRLPAGLKHLLPHPADGSACKRWNLYLRWMGRGGGTDIDPGDWRPRLQPRQLIVPLDVHLFRTALREGWTERRAPSWKAAEDVTARLRGLDPSDPLRYDFALTRPGILKRMGSPGKGTSQDRLEKRKEVRGHGRRDSGAGRTSG